MASKTVPISVRISHEDAEFLSQLRINGTTTPSDKLRVIITEARQKSMQRHDYLGCLNIMKDLLSPAHDNIKNAENQLQLHSELVTRLIEWLPDMCAYFISSSTTDEENLSQDLLNRIEEALSDRIFRLIESILQMGVTRRCPCYNEQLIADNIGPVQDLVQLIMLSRKKEENDR